MSCKLLKSNVTLFFSLFISRNITSNMYLPKKKKKKEIVREKSSCTATQSFEILHLHIMETEQTQRIQTNNGPSCNPGRLHDQHRLTGRIHSDHVCQKHRDIQHHHISYMICVFFFLLPSLSCQMPEPWHSYRVAQVPPPLRASSSRSKYPHDWGSWAVWASAETLPCTGSALWGSSLSLSGCKVLASKDWDETWGLWSTSQKLASIPRSIRREPVPSPHQ